MSDLAPDEAHALTAEVGMHLDFHNAEVERLLGLIADGERNGAREALPPGEWDAFVIKMTGEILDSQAMIARAMGADRD